MKSRRNCPKLLKLMFSSGSNSMESSEEVLWNLETLKYMPIKPEIKRSQKGSRNDCYLNLTIKYSFIFTIFKLFFCIMF